MLIFFVFSLIETSQNDASELDVLFFSSPRSEGYMSLYSYRIPDVRL